MATSFSGYRDLEKAKEGLLSYVRDKTIRAGLETEFHVIHANQTMNPAYKELSYEHYMICSGSYLKQLQENKRPIKVHILASEKVEPL